MRLGVNGGAPCRWAITLGAAAGMLLLAGCGPEYRTTYPSYDYVVSQYLPPGEYPSERLGGVPSRCSSAVCDCPRLMYHGHWVYHCDGRWIYWDDGYWFHYPCFYVYYWRGGYHVFTHADRRITKDSHAPSEGGAHRATPPSDHRSGVQSVPAQRSSFDRHRDRTPPPARSEPNRRSKPSRKKRK